VTTNYTLLVMVDAAGKPLVIADPARAPKGMSYSIASREGHAVYEISVAREVMRLPRDTMIKAVRDQLKDPGQRRPHKIQIRRKP
jgi:uncharacterized circularly permuted ATP-grasp superfamily protein